MAEDKKRKEKKILCSKILREIKGKIRAFVFDFDGTIKSFNEPDCVPLELIKKIDWAGKFVSIITASGVSALNGLGREIIEDGFDQVIYLGVANGMGLYKLDHQGKHELYRYPIEIKNVNKILEAWKKVMKREGLKGEDLVEKGRTTFNEFLKRDWENDIPNTYLSLAGTFGGKCFAEELKVTFVMPKSEVLASEKFVAMMQTEIDKLIGKEKFVIEMGDATYAHVTSWPGMDPKLFALRKIMEVWAIEENELAVFGDMPFGNDRGMLVDSRLPYTFTNKYFVKKKIGSPPFVLSGSEMTPVESVYKAVINLLK